MPLRILPGSGHYPLEMYRRNLPHWHPHGAVLFVTWRLFGTHPKAAHTFLDMERELDRAVDMPCWLLQPAVAGSVVDTIRQAEISRRLCQVESFVVMPNHVHLLLAPCIELQSITKWIKGASARRANQILGRTGQPFWQDESFDHWVRDRWEFGKLRRYVEYNPVQAGLTKRPEDWPYSSAADRRAQTEVCATSRTD